MDTSNVLLTMISETVVGEAKDQVEKVAESKALEAVVGEETVEEMKDVVDDLLEADSIEDVKDAVEDAVGIFGKLCGCLKLKLKKK